MKYKLLTILIPVVFLIFISLYWLAFSLFSIGIIYFILTSQYFIVVSLRKNFWLYTLCIIGMVFAFAIFIRVFTMDIYDIPSASMERCLLVGDKVVMSKLHYGPKMPKSPFEIPWVNLFVYMNKEARAAIDSTWWGHKRLNGFSIVRRKDVVVFNHPDKRDKNFYIKRCMGLPGELIELKNGKVYINNVEIPSLDTEQHSDEDFPIKITSGKDSLTWNIHNWGPIRIPKIGKKIELTAGNWILYQKIMEQYEGVDLQKKGQEFYIDGIKKSAYTFENNYYFMMGDNRSNSMDSRYWGVVPEENILGKAILVIYSMEKGVFRWDRVLKKIE